MLQHKGLDIEEKLCRNKRQRIAIKMEECNKSAKTKKVNVATRFISWMSTPGRICYNIEAHVTTKEAGRKHKLCSDKVSSVATRN